MNAPVRIAVLEQTAGDYKARILSDDELLEHRANVEAAKDAMRNYKQRMASSEGAVDIPTPPSQAPTVSSAGA